MLHLKQQCLRHSTHIKGVKGKFFEHFARSGYERLESGSLIPDQNDSSLLFTNAGMVPFKSLFTGKEKGEFNRATTSQRCLRAGGKHNDLDNVGFTRRHHTLFEMLGNFIFNQQAPSLTSQQTKEEAIELSYQFLTNELSLDKSRLYVTYHPSDSTAYSLWKKMGVKESQIRSTEGDENFWSMGELPASPCGPCSELFYDLGDKFSSHDERYLEIWNLVFMEYEYPENTSGSSQKNWTQWKSLGQPSIDTGMGLERIQSVLLNGESNYCIPVFQDLISKIIEVLSVQTDAPLVSYTDEYSGGLQQSQNVALRVIADHIRAIAFLLAEGVIPSPNGRGYVLRRILRRAVRYGYLLGFRTPFLYALLPTVRKHHASAFPALDKEKAIISTIVQREEDIFLKTIQKGLRLLQTYITRKVYFNSTPTGSNQTESEAKTLPSKSVYNLYRTCGFPVDLTEVILKEKGWRINEDEVNSLLLSHQKEAESSWKDSMTEEDMAKLFFEEQEDEGEGVIGISNAYVTSSSLSIETTIRSVYVVPPDDSLESSQSCCWVWLVLDKNPFYARGGGQVADQGTLTISASTSNITSTVTPTAIATTAEVQFEVKDCIELNEDSHCTAVRVRIDKSLELQESLQKAFQSSTSTSRLSSSLSSSSPTSSLASSSSSSFSDAVHAFFSQCISNSTSVLASVDSTHRQKTSRNHTATHLLQAALSKVMDTSTSTSTASSSSSSLSAIAQAGSFVGPESLRFDFTSRPLTKAELAEVEQLVNSVILSNLSVTVKEMDFKEAIEIGAKSLAGEQYAEQVRVVRVGEDETFSLELCGGTHVETTSEISQFKILSHSSVSSGVRRIEAVTSHAALRYMKGLQDTVMEVKELLKAPEVEGIVPKVSRLLREHKELRKEVSSLKATQALQSNTNSNSSSNSSSEDEATEEISVGMYEKNTPVVVRVLKSGVEEKFVRENINNLRSSDPTRVHILVSHPVILCSADLKHHPNFHCGKFLKTFFNTTGFGKGGGSAVLSSGKVKTTDESGVQLLRELKSLLDICSLKKQK